jgi:hypothetical protein
MRYMLSIFVDERGWIEATPEQIRETMEAYGAFGEEVEAKGIYVAGEGLQPTATATSVQVRDGERIVSDGPFAETKEQLGGFYLLECKDLDEAIGWAAKIPGAQVGTIEVRPVMDYEAMRAGDVGGAATSRA